MPVLHFLDFLFFAMWGNIFAPSVWTLLGIGIADLRNHRRHATLNSKNNKEISQNKEQLRILTGHVETLSGMLKDVLDMGKPDA